MVSNTKAIASNTEWYVLWVKIENETRSVWEACRTIYQRHSDLLSQLTTLALNTVILASKIIQKIPSIIPRFANTALSFTGLLYLNLQVRDLLKVGGDLVDSIKTKDLEGIVFVSARVTVKALNILLGIGMMGATLVALCGFPAVALAMYGIMRPFALFSLFIGIGLEVYDYKKNGALLKKFQKLEHCPEKISKVVMALREQIQKKTNKSVCSKEEQRLVLHTFRQLEHFRVDALRKEFFEEKLFGEGGGEEKLFEKIKTAFEQKRVYIQANLGLISLGYLCMGICKMWPDTLVQSATVWGISLLYTTKLIYQKITQIQWV